MQLKTHFKLKAISYTLLPLITATLLLTSCASVQKKESVAQPLVALTGLRGDLISAKNISYHRSEDIQHAMAYYRKYGLDIGNAKYNVTKYKISYKTLNLNGELIQASGLVSIPNKRASKTSPIISHQHGTIFTQEYIPSKNSGVYTHTTSLASLGYILSEPDYLGYGDSAYLKHPYVHSKTLASSSVDMLRATMQFLEQKNIANNGQLFLMGYSEGGKSTLALQREIEKSLTSEFQITASVPSAGPYDMEFFADYVMNSSEMFYPAFNMWALYAFHDIYNLGSISDVVNSKYVDVINNSFNGDISGPDINAQLTQKTSDLLLPEYILAYQNGGAQKTKAALRENNDFNWTPKVPTVLFHGKDDLSVPYQNSLNAYNKMVENGSTSVQLVDCDTSFSSTNHENCYFPSVNYTIGFFSDYANDL